MTNPLRRPNVCGEQRGFPSGQWVSFLDLMSPTVTVPYATSATSTATDLRYDTEIISPAYAAQTSGILDTQQTLGNQITHLKLQFYSNSDNNDVFGFYLMAYNMGGPGVLVYHSNTGSCAVGTAACSKYPVNLRDGTKDEGEALSGGKWADTIDGTDTWSSVTLDNTAANTIAAMSFPIKGFRFFKIYPLLSSATTATVGCIASGYTAV